MLAFFKHTLPREHCALLVIAEEAGGLDEVLKDDKVMANLLQKQEKLEALLAQDASTLGASGGSHRRMSDYYYTPRSTEQHRLRTVSPPNSALHAIFGTPSALYTTGSSFISKDSEPLDTEIQFLRQELRDAPASAVRKNASRFEVKFHLMQQEIAQEMRKVVTAESNRVIDSLTAGPHEKIIDPVCYLSIPTSNQRIDVTDNLVCISGAVLVVERNGNVSDELLLFLNVHADDSST